MTVVPSKKDTDDRLLFGVDNRLLVFLKLVFLIVTRLLTFVKLVFVCYCDKVAHIH